MLVKGQKVIKSYDVLELIKDLEEEYGEVFWTHIEGELYIYKAIGRKTYKDIVTNKDSSLEEKKDSIVEACILHPEDFNLDELYAGIAEELLKNIKSVSYLDSDQSINEVIEFFRYDMRDMDNQITCIIHEAFPQFTLEEIEDWGIEKTAKYLSRAEFKLKNFRNMEFNEDYFNVFENANPASAPETEEKKNEESEPVKENSKVVSSSPKKETLTPEKLAELKRKYPDIDWEGAEGLNGQGSLEGGSIDTLSPALRPMTGW